MKAAGQKTPEFPVVAENHEAAARQLLRSGHRQVAVKWDAAVDEKHDQQKARPEDGLWHDRLKPVVHSKAPCKSDAPRMSEKDAEDELRTHLVRAAVKLPAAN
jgi:hypothetical protein